VDKQCSSSLSLVCSQADYLSVTACPNLYPVNRCDCAKTKYYDNSLGCVTRIKYSQYCTSDCQCVNGLNMICSTTCVSCSPGVACVSVSCSQQCYCPTNMYWTNMNMGCVLQKGYGAVCSATVQCSTALKLVCSTVNDQSYGPTSLAINHCDCLVSQYYDNSVGCVTRKSINQVCSMTYQCVVNANLICSGGYCVCKNGYIQYSGACILGKQYGDTCTATAQCLQNLKLICSTGNNCVCPNSMGAGYCDCPSTMYYNTTLGCGKRIVYCFLLIYEQDL
jgi:hypothetical protein